MHKGLFSQLPWARTCLRGAEVALLVGLLAACSKTSDDVTPPATDEVTESDEATNDVDIDKFIRFSQRSRPEKKDNDIDLDLSRASATIAYAQLVHLWENPTAWVGKTIQLRGRFMTETDEKTHQRVYLCKVDTGCTCCEQWMSFRPKEAALQFPDQFPKIQAPFTLKGRFEVAPEADTRRYLLVDATISY